MKSFLIIINKENYKRPSPKCRNTGIVFSVPWLACRTLFAQIRQLHKELFLGNRTAHALSIYVLTLSGGRIVYKRGTGNKMERWASL